MKNKGILLCLGLLLFGCNNSNVTSSSNSSNETIVYSISGPTEMGVGDVVLYTINYEGSISWSSSDSLVIDINSKGEAVSYKEGSALISASDSNNTVLASLDVTVVNKLSYPKNELDISSLFNNAIELEKETSKSKLLITSSSINQTYTQEATMYEDFYINVTKDEYTNYSGYHNEESVDFVGIKGDYFYDISDSNTSPYGIKREIVSSNPTDYEILQSEALKRAQSPRFVYYFYSKLVDLWGARTLDLNIECSDTEDGFKVNLSNTYLFVWANGVDNDSRYYEAELFFNNNGNFLNGTYKATTYEDSQYDVENKNWIDNPKVKNIETYTYEATLGAKAPNSEAKILPEEYFVTSVTSACYEPENPLEVGSRIISDYIVLKEYEGPKALDTKNVLIKGIKNDGSEVVIMEDTLNGGYEIVNKGKAYLICQMMYSSEITFLVEIIVE